jgi:hypothetical protein
MIPFYPSRSDNQVVTPNAVSASVIINGEMPSVRFANSGSKVCYVKLGSGSLVATTSDIPVLPGESVVLGKGIGDNACAFISAEGTTLNIQTGIGGVLGYSAPQNDVGTIDLVNVTALLNEVPIANSPNYFIALIDGLLKRVTPEAFDASSVALAIEAGTDTIIPNDTDVFAGVKADHSLLKYTWASLKAAILTAIGKVNAAVGFTLAGGTTSKTLTVSADADSKDIPTAAEKASLSATSGGSPWSVPTLYFIDLERARLERLSGGRATVFYSADGAKVPIQAVWVDAFAMADVSPYYSRARANSAAYVLGEWLMANSQLYEVTTAGTTGSSAPTYGVNPGDTVNDGTAVLTLRVNSYDDLFPGFKVAGVSKGGKWVSRFLCSAVGANPMSIGGQLPASATINAIRTYASKFSGASPMGYWDYEALALDAFRKGVVPVGNTNYGRSHKTTESVWGGVRGDGARPGNTAVSSNPYTRGGSAGLIWTHDRTMWGVHDFVGNMSQWCDGAKWMDGQLYIAAYDADPALFSTGGEASWIATGIYLNSPVAGDDSGSSDLGAPNFDSVITNYTASLTPPRDTATIQADTRDLDYATGVWGSLTVSAGVDSVDAVKRLAAFRMGVLPKSRSGGPSPVSAQEGRQYIRNNGERFVLRGGDYSSASNAGPRYSNANPRRASATAFRLVFNG